MREILFRAYDKGRKEYLSGGHLFIAINKDKRPNKSEIYLDEISNADKYKDRFIIEQYTGLIDKNGKKIFEGDIMSYISGDGDIRYLEVAFKDGYFCYIEEGNEWDNMLYCLDLLNAVVAGNMHDNPELLEE